MAKGTLAKSETLLAAMKIIDPENTLTPESPARRAITGTILRWVDEMGPEKTLQMIERSKEHLRSQAEYLATM
jgi:hypothetical protein